MERPVCLASALVFVGGCLLMLAGQRASTEVFKGGAMPLESNHEFLTLCEPHNCSLLRGKVENRWAGHTVKLRGVLHAATSTQPRTISVEEVLEVGEACKAACQPAISGRGIGPKDKPQGEGGTPGAAPTNPTPPGY